MCTYDLIAGEFQTLKENKNAFFTGYNIIIVPEMEKHWNSYATFLC